MEKKELYVVIGKGLDIWDDLKSAINYYTHVYNVAKNEKRYYYPEYAGIVLDLMLGCQYSNPRNSKNCNEIRDYRGLNQNSFIRYPFPKRMNVSEALYVWDKKIKLVLDVCKAHDIDYEKKGFKETELVSMKYFYVDLFEKFNTTISSICLDLKDDLFGTLIIDESINFDISKKDKIMDVLNNIQFVSKEIEKKNVGYEFDFM